MNEENPAEGRNEQQAEVEDDITEITSAEIEMALRNMKSGKATGTGKLLDLITYYRQTCRRVWEELE